MREWWIDWQMFVRKIKKLCYKNITHKSNQIRSSEFNMTLGYDNRSTGNKCFCKSEEELMCPITGFHLEDLWRVQNPYTCLYMHSHG